MMYKIVAFFVKWGVRVICRIDASGIEKIPLKGPVIGYANHSAMVEVPVFFGILQPRRITGWAKIELWDNWFFRWIFGLWNIIPIKRGEADTTALRRAVEALDEGYIFGLAPEGTRNVTGQLKRAHPGAVMLALHSGAPLIPIAHWGGENFTKNIKRLKRTDFHVRVGDPICLKLDGKRVTREMRQQIVDEMMYRLADLMPPEYRGEYQKVTDIEYFFTDTCRINLSDLS
jgi:1-acyl-sn-glycerol-3-phosphate acyltransferase